MASTIWRPFRSGAYEISEFGVVRRVRPTARRQRHGIGFMPRPHPDPDGYLRVYLYAEGEKTFPVHRLVAEVFHGPCPVGKQVNHIDANKLNNHWSNLEYVTPQENRAHQQRLGLNATGERHARAKLTEQQVRDIRAFAASHPQSQSQLARIYGVSQSLMWAIVHRRIWRAA
jgi:hypothetical protein